MTTFGMGRLSDMNSPVVVESEVKALRFQNLNLRESLRHKEAEIAMLRKALAERHTAWRLLNED